mgnify:CR=1 FL=1
MLLVDSSVWIDADCAVATDATRFMASRDEAEELATTGVIVRSDGLVAVPMGLVPLGMSDSQLTQFKVILPPGVQELWLDPAAQDVAQVCDLLVPYPAEAMAVHPVGAVVSA